MTDEQKEIVRTEAFWIDTWLRSQYEGVERRYIIHDAAAKEVDENTFYHTRESGGTRISSAYKVCQDLIDKQVSDPAEWNIYCFQFSDGDNWGEDNRAAPGHAQEKRCCRKCNLFCYGQVESPYGSGEFYRVLEEAFGERARNARALGDREQRRRFTSRSRSFWGKESSHWSLVISHWCQRMTTRH